MLLGLVSLFFLVSNAAIYVYEQKITHALSSNLSSMQRLHPPDTGVNRNLIRVQEEESCPMQISVKLFHSADEHLEVGPLVTDRDVLVTMFKHYGFHLDLERVQHEKQYIT